MNTIYTIFEDFKNENIELFKYKDGLNGDCKLFAIKLFNHYKNHNFNPKIYCTNKGIHYWIEINEFAIDCRGVFKNRNLLLRYFKKFITKERISAV